MAVLFNVTVDSISLHIRNILREGELDDSVVEESSVTAIDGKKYITKLYNLDMIIAVGCRVKSKRGIIFRKWAIKVIKEHLVQGYSINQKRLEVLNKTVDIQTRMLAYSLNIDKEELSKVINEYTRALDLLDNYDHQTLVKPKGEKAAYVMSYQEARHYRFREIQRNV